MTKLQHMQVQCDSCGYVGSDSWDGGCSLGENGWTEDPETGLDRCEECSDRIRMTPEEFRRAWGTS